MPFFLRIGIEAIRDLREKKKFIDRNLRMSGPYFTIDLNIGLKMNRSIFDGQLPGLEDWALGLLTLLAQD